MRNIILIILMLIIVSCASEESSWKKAVEINTIEAYENFIIKYPNSKFANHANKKIVLLSGDIFWENSKNGYYLDSRDKHEYKVIKIGDQVWMAENLAYKASDGCWAYEYDQNNVSKYGYLYTWETAKNVCPNGWHLPSDAEWSKLIGYLGGESVAAKKLKSTNGWTYNGNNESGFNALPSGSLYNGHFNDKCCLWWSATAYGFQSMISYSELAWNRSIYDNLDEVLRRGSDLDISIISVRCLKDN